MTLDPFLRNTDLFFRSHLQSWLDLWPHFGNPQDHDSGCRLGVLPRSLAKRPRSYLYDLISTYSPSSASFGVWPSDESHASISAPIRILCFPNVILTTMQYSDVESTISCPVHRASSLHHSCTCENRQTGRKPPSWAYSNSIICTTSSSRSVACERVECPRSKNLLVAIICHPV